MDADLPPPDESPPRDGTDLPAAELTDRLEPARAWLVAELRDECSDIGVSARGFDFDGFLRGVRTFAREARRLGAPAERMLVLLKRCLADEHLPREDRQVYERYHDEAMTTAIATYYEGADDAAGPAG